MITPAMHTEVVDGRFDECLDDMIDTLQRRKAQREPWEALAEIASIVRGMDKGRNSLQRNTSAVEAFSLLKQDAYTNHPSDLVQAAVLAAKARVLEVLGMTAEAAKEALAK